MNLSLNVVANSHDENNSPHNLLLTNTRVSKLSKGFAKNSSANIKLSKTHLHKIVKSGEFFGRILGPLAKSVLIPLELTASATDAATHKKNV